MSAVLYPEDSFARLLLAVVCYFGVVLYATSAAIRGPTRAPAEAFVGIVYAAMFPLPSSLPLAHLIQFCVFVTAMATLGALQLRRSVLRLRELRAYRAGTAAGPMSPATMLVLFAPAVALSVYLVIGTVAFGDWTSAWNTSVEIGVWKLFSVVALLSLYMGLSSYLDRDWVRSVGRIRLLTVDSRFLWINVVVGVVAVLAVAVILAGGVGSRMSGYAALVAVTVGLLPALNGLSWIYDAVFRRVLSFHLLLAASAVVALAVKTLEAPLNLSPLSTWAVLLGAVGLTAVTLSPLIDKGLERWLFPRAGEMRARLMAIAAEPPATRTRAEAAAGMLDSLVRVLDAEGGAIVVHPARSEPAAVERVGSVETSVLGSSPEEIARYVGRLTAQGGPHVMDNLPLPHVIESLPLADQLRLLDAGVYLICPLVARATEATLLLGPRRGWLYDDATLRALRVLARQLGLALENLTLANARAHGEKLEALGGAAARIAHEIRNPLAGARSLVQLLGRSDADGLATPAVEELDRIGRLVDDLLAFARRDDAAVREAVDLAAVCGEAVRETGGLAGDGPIEVRTDLRETFVRGDRRRLVQVFANLCRNAFEALREAAPPRRLTLRCAALDGHAVVEVRDNGPGISAEQRSRLFEPFCTTKSSGTGLGLPIARGIVESHGGRIVVESGAGTETVFRVELPLAVASDAQGSTPALRGSSQARY